MTIPERVARRPRYKGYPIPFTTLVVNDIPDFKGTDLDKWRDCITNRLCGICGERLDYWVWWLGGPACFEHGHFFDFAMHEDCARYSATICPYIAYTRQYADWTKMHEGYTLNILPVNRASVTMYLGRGRRNAIRLVEENGQRLVYAGPLFDQQEVPTQVLTHPPPH